MKDVQDYLREAKVSAADDLERLLKRVQDEAFAEGYRAAGNQMLAIGERSIASISHLADHARRATA